MMNKRKADVLKAAEDDPYQAIEMLVNDITTISNEVYELRKEIEHIKSPLEVAHRAKSGAVADAIKFLFSNTDPDAQSEAVLQLQYKQGESVAALDLYYCGDHLFGTWSLKQDNIMPFALPGDPPPHDNDFPRIAKWDVYEDFENRALPIVLNPRNEWSLQTVGYIGCTLPIKIHTLVWRKS
jgi:hypothetical protein